MKSLALVLSTLFFILSHPSLSLAEEICGNDQADGINYRWCVDHNPASPDVLYIMHGGGGSERSWREKGANQFFEKYWAETGRTAPSIITVSFHKGQWLLSDMDSWFDLSVFTKVAVPIDTFVEEIMPALEAKAGGVRGKRLMMGWSMGGYNAPVLSLRYPNLFDSVALLCPGLGMIDPFLPSAELERAILALPVGTNPDYVRGVAAWVRREFETKENWLRHEPITLARNLTQTKTKYYVTCTKDDQYGFFPGANDFVSIMNEKTSTGGHPVEWYPMVSGGHCAQDLESKIALADFLSR